MGLHPGGPAQPALPILPEPALADVHSPANLSPTLVTINTKPLTTFLAQVKWSSVVPALLSSERLTMWVLGLFLLSCVWCGWMGPTAHTPKDVGATLTGIAREATAQRLRPEQQEWSALEPRGSCPSKERGLCEKRHEGARVTERGVSPWTLMRRSWNLVLRARGGCYSNAHHVCSQRLL